MSKARPKLRIASLFSGVGGFELGFKAAGYHPVLFCESNPAARAVLQCAWPDVEISEDIRKLKKLPDCEVITAGFPCQDLSQAGHKAGIRGSQSGLVGHLFRLLGRLTHEPDWIVVENVPYMLGLNKGAAMGHLINNFERLGFSWAYRVIDSRAFGLPQRRARVILLASRVKNPEAALASEDTHAFIDEKPSVIRRQSSYGFYWTEGSRGLGWVRDAVPPIKGGSGFGIPSPPAIWIPSTGELGKPTIRDAERLQGLPVDWTLPAISSARSREGTRWRLVGNAVNVETATWIAKRLKEKVRPAKILSGKLDTESRWPAAAAGQKGARHRLLVGSWPVHEPLKQITTFLSEPLVPLSHRAASGFLKRALGTPKLVYANEFLDFLRAYCRRLEGTTLKRVG